MMNLNELYAKISANFWKESQVTSWVERYFYRRGSHQQTSSGTGSGNLPIITLSTGYIDPSFIEPSFALLPDIATDSLVGRDTAGTGSPENIGLNATLSMTGSGSLQRAALAGDVTASAGSNATTIANNAVTTAKILDANVTNAKLANMVQATIKGRAAAAGTGAPTDLTAAEIVAIITATLDDTFMLRSGGAAAQMTGQLLLAAAGIAFMNAGSSTLTAGTGPAVIAGGGLEADGFLKVTRSDKTISGGVITATHTYTAVDTEGGAATDDLDTINGGVNGEIIIIRTAASARDVVIRDATGNISCPANRTLSHIDDVWVGFYNGARWCEISFADNAA